MGRMAVFFYDLLRTTRRGRVALMRTAYGLALLVALGSVFLRWFPGRLTVADAFAPGEPLLPSQLSQFAEQFTATCILVQFAAVLLLTPAYAAGAVAEERQRGTLDQLLTTELTGGQIVLGKLASRLAHLVGVLLTGVPVLALMPLWGGGASYAVVAAGFAVSAATLASLGALSLYCSAKARTARTAAAAAYLVMAGFGALTWCLPVIQLANPLYVLAELFAVTGGGAAANDWRILVAVYGGWHAALFVGFTRAAALAVRGPQEAEQGVAWTEVYAAAVARRVAEKTAVALPSGSLDPVPHLRALRLARDGAGPRLPVPVVRLFPLPPVGRDALVWKELYFGGGSAAGELTRMTGAALLGVAFSAGLAYAAAALGGLTRQVDLTREVNLITRGLTATLGTAIGIGTVLRAAAAVGRERERRTLDGLLTLPGGRDAVLRAKWVGSVLRARYLLLALAALWAVAVCAGGLGVPAVACLLTAGAAHLAASASLGLYVSVVTHGAGRAMVVALAVLLVAWVLPPVAAGYWLGAIPAARDHAWLTAWLEEGLVAPVTSWDLAFPGGAAPAPSSDGRTAGLALGLATYALAAWLLWQAARRRFSREAG
jgi:ABC-type transport system involved in multi-copper enzyme maturation permease subunit